MLNNGKSYTLLLGVYIGSVTLEKNLAFFSHGEDVHSLCLR